MSEDMKTGTSCNDIKSEHWLHKISPTKVRPFLILARVDRPIGTWLLLLPCWWGLALAKPENFSHLVYFGCLFAIGAFFMRGAGCVWNDIIDRKYDARVARTSSRPIASGEVSVVSAFAFMTLLTSVGLVILLQFNSSTIWICIASLFLVALYPLTKRITYWPQAWLGLTFNWGALAGWTATAGTLETPAYCLYAAGFFWTLGYDTIYAHQDKEDDALVGIRSTALLFGSQTKYCLSGFYICAIIMFVVAGVYSESSVAFYLGIGIAGLQLGWQVCNLDIADPLDCLHKFQSNKWLGFLITIAIVGDSWLLF